MHGTGPTQGNQHWLINQQGTASALRRNGVYEAPEPIHLWARENTLPFEKVGAGIGMHIGDTFYTILFNEEGTKYSVSSKNNDFDNEGPFDL